MRIFRLGINVMSVTAVESHSIVNDENVPIFSLSIIDFEQACVANEDQFVDSFNIIWIKEGKARYNVDLNHYNLEDETLFFLNPGQVFAINSEQIKVGYRITFIPDFYCIETKDRETACNGLLFNNIYDRPYITPDPHTLAELESIVKQMITEFLSPDTSHEELIRVYLKLFLIKASRIKKEQLRYTTKPEDSDHEIVRQFISLVEKHFREVHSVSQYADMLNISAKTLTKKLHSLDRKAPSDFIKERLVLEAKRELIYTAKSVKEIAYDLGFIDPAYFNRFFKKASGLSPASFKEDYLQVREVPIVQ